jgi:hypothetical protein
MKVSQIQKQLDQLFKMNGLEGTVTINVKVEFSNYSELQEKQNNDLLEITCPENANRDGHCFYSKSLTVYIMHVRS